MSTVSSATTGLSSLPSIKREKNHGHQLGYKNGGGKIVAGAAVEEYKPGQNTRALLTEAKNLRKHKQSPIIYVQALPKV